MRDWDKGDITERLRDPLGAIDFVHEAADEIERLRAELAHIRAIAGPVSLESGLVQIKKDIRNG